LPAPHWTQSIRFRLSLFYAVAVFSCGSILIGGLYMWQVSRLDESQLSVQTIDWVDPATEQPIARVLLLNRADLEDAARIVEYNANLRALDNLRKGSLGALAILFVASFGTGWWVAGWALRPVHRMTRVARDITASDLSRRIHLPGPDDELKGLADTFDAMLDRLETGFEDQRRFVQDASHELRNPLAVARTNLDVVLSDPDASVDDLRRSAEVARRSTQRMASLVDDLLEQARSGVPEFSLDGVDLVALAAEVVDEYRAGADQRKIRIALDAPPVPLVVKGDGSALRRAVGNLLSNALKAGPTDSTVTVRVAEDAGRVTVSVADCGPGLTEDDQRRVFERFWRGDPTGNGIGLGLSIVRHIAQRHGGTATVTSEPGVGSTFAIELPTGARR
jgi:signal transduction histidine kinase